MERLFPAGRIERRIQQCACLPLSCAVEPSGVGIRTDPADAQRRIGKKNRADVVFFRKRAGLFPAESGGDVNLGVA
jgi:hypothetical protein